MAAFIKFLMTFGAPALQLMLQILPILRQIGILRDEIKQRELEARLKEAIKQAEKTANEPTDARNQYKRAREAAKDAYDKELGGAVPPSSDNNGEGA